MAKVPVLAVCVCLTAAGCGGGDDESTAPVPAPAPRDVPPGAKVVVPDRDESPPSGIASLAVGGRTLARAPEPGDGPDDAVELERPRLTGTMVGSDPESGSARVRVSVKELITCELRSGSVTRVQKVQYFPPSQIERVRSSPGARIPVRARRSVAVRVGEGRCPRGAAASEVSGELWGDVTNGLGLEAVTSHIRFEWRR